MSEQVAQLQEELNRIEKAIPPEEAAKSLKDYIDQTASQDWLAGTGVSGAKEVTEWTKPSTQSNSCCVLS